MKVRIGLVVSSLSLLFTFLLFSLLDALKVLPARPSLKFIYALIFFLLFAGVWLWGVFDHRSPLFGRCFWRGPKNLPLLALTFDDGPTEPFTSEIIEILRKYQVKVTFFVLGRKVALYPEAVKKIAAEGHEIGNHGYDHKVLPLKFPYEIKAEIKRTEDLLLSLTDKKPVLFRAPHGWKGPWLKKAVREAGYKLISWTAGVWDTDRPGEQVIVERSLKAFKNGAILLFHDGRGREENPDCRQIVAALPTIIEAALSRGYQLVTVSRLIEISNLPSVRNLD
jgi:peptidoglycan/xylan/chitin deacetylase (PgdA/CDA1 family)